MVTWLRTSSAAKIFVINEISVSLQKKKYPNWMSFSSLNCQKCVSHRGICMCNGLFLRHGATGLINRSLQNRLFFLTRDPMRRGRQPLPWNHFLTRPNSRSVESSNRSHSKIRLAGYINPFLSNVFKNHISSRPTRCKAGLRCILNPLFPFISNQFLVITILAPYTVHFLKLTYSIKD